MYRLDKFVEEKIHLNIFNIVNNFEKNHINISEFVDTDRKLKF